MQRTKLGFVFLSVAISLDSCSLYSWPTVRNIPLRVLKAPCISDMPVTLSRPTMLSTERGGKTERRRHYVQSQHDLNISPGKLKSNAHQKGEWIWALSLHLLLVNTTGERKGSSQNQHQWNATQSHTKVHVERGTNQEGGWQRESHKASEVWKEHTQNLKNKTCIKCSEWREFITETDSLLLLKMCAMTDLNMYVPEKVTNIGGCSGHVLLWWH